MRTKKKGFLLLTNTSCIGVACQKGTERRPNPFIPQPLDDTKHPTNIHHYYTAFKKIV